MAKTEDYSTVQLVLTDHDTRTWTTPKLTSEEFNDYANLVRTHGIIVRLGKDGADEWFSPQVIASLKADTIDP